MEYSQSQLQGFLTQVRKISEDIKNIDISSLISEFQGNVSDLTDLLNLIKDELNEIENTISTQTTYSMQLEGAINNAVTAANNAASAS
jgi:uncharacterized phage infection (PIP) family protein YhgE